MGIVNADAAVAQGAANLQAVLAVQPAVAPATITNEPVVLPATGAVEPVAAAVEVVAPVIADQPVVEPVVEQKAPAAPLTKGEQLAAKIDVLEKRIEADTKKLEQLKGLLNAVDLLEGIKAGSLIVAKVGRADTAKEVTATVVGVQTLESGDKRFKIYYGEGFEADTVVIQESQIVDVKQV